MTSKHWERTQELFFPALERQGKSRSAFLDKSCGGDEALRHEVESLLAYANASEKFLETPAFELMHEPLVEIWKDENQQTDYPPGGKMAFLDGWLRRQGSVVRIHGE
ncbi:MAG: hypothetical protein WCA92_06280 [Terriglobales bacterium]